VGEAGETISARNSHSLHVISIPTAVTTTSSISSSDSSSSSGSGGEKEGQEKGGVGVDSYLVLFGGSSPELGPLGDTYYAPLPPGGVTSK
jgi:hypothetical protein